MQFLTNKKRSNVKSRHITALEALDNTFFQKIQKRTKRLEH